jgi:uncharacterized protein YeaO (DUF488 family)
MIETARWNDPAPPRGTRILVTRYRPRGVRKSDETWSEWHPNLGPSRELHADYYGKNGAPIGWTEFEKRYLAEMQNETSTIELIAERVRAGEPITLLCSSACVDESRCHRSLLAVLVRAAMDSMGVPVRHNVAF